MPALRIGTRASDLALWQAQHVAARLSALEPGRAIDLVPITTTGDELADAPLERMEGTGFFTSTIEARLLAGEIDLAVHSYKDLPVVATAGLAVGAVLERAPVEDVLCAREGWTLERLPRGARVGTSSPRRSAQLKGLRPDLDFRPLRGNLPTRLARVERGELEAIVLARAGLVRLGLEGRISEIFPVERVLPAPAQGALAVHVRACDPVAAAAVAPLDHEDTRRAVESERAVLHALRGGCSVPVGAHARACGARVELEAGVFDPADGGAIRARDWGSEPLELGRRVSERLLALGADRVLAAIDRTAGLAAPRVR